MVRFQVSLRVRCPDVHALQAVADVKVHPLIWQSTRGTTTVAEAVADPPAPVATTVYVVVCAIGKFAVALRATAAPFTVTVVALVVRQVTEAVPDVPSVAVIVAVGGVGRAGMATEASLDAGPYCLSEL